MRPSGRHRRVELGSAADTRAHACECVLVADDASTVGVGKAGLNGLANVDFVGEIIPRRRVGKTLNKLSRIRLDVAGVAHTDKLIARRGGPQAWTERESVGIHRRSISVRSAGTALTKVDLDASRCL